ncbi:MAG: ubiquinol-cytochrome C chaperone [Hyphomonadaceae bacterium]|nr:ubiquinol-cytochrome C chaperone [Hyphomonadaceae bacterium]
MLGWFRKRPEEAAAARLLDTVVRVSRQPGFYGEGRVPDTLQGRLEVLQLHAILALRRLKAEPSAAALAQVFTDRLFANIDAGLREDGVGDLSVPKKMYKVAGGFYGRLPVYDGALSAADRTALTEAIGRNVLAAADAPYAATLADHALAAAAALAQRPLPDMERLDAWGAAPV